MAYKIRSAFEQYLAMAVAAEAAVIRSLARYGHEMLYQGFGAGDSAVWTDPRLKGRHKPDLICKHCDQRVEVKSKAKARFALSDGAGRSFDNARRELAPGDWLAFVQVRREGGVWGAVAGYYVQVEALTQARPYAFEHAPKSAALGAESWLEWPTLAPPVSGFISSLSDPSESGPIIIRRVNDLHTVLPHFQPQHAYVKIGQPVKAGVGLLAGCVPILWADRLQCQGTR